MRKIAIIDMGTNTFHLLLAGTGTQGNRIIYRDHEVVRIGKGGINDGIITDEACDRAINAMKRFKTIIDEHGIEEIYAYGTSALRNAVNGRALAERITSLTGIPIRIISGDEEADLIFAGIQYAIDLSEEASLIMDIGAGSVEFVIGNQAGIVWKQSFEIGGQRLLERFMKHDPIAPDEIKRLDVYFQDVLSPLAAKLREHRPEVLVGSSGSFDTLSEIYCVRSGLPYHHDAPETPLTVDAFYDIHRDLVSKNRDERMAIRGMIEMRVEMIVVASCLIRFVLELHAFKTLRVSTYSLKEGALARLGEAVRHP